MKTSDIKSNPFFRGTKSGICDALGVTRQAGSEWIDEEIPQQRQYELEYITWGDIQAEWPDHIREQRAAYAKFRQRSA